MLVMVEEIINSNVVMESFYFFVVGGVCILISFIGLVILMLFLDLKLL